MKVEINVRVKGKGWVRHYYGPRENIPEQYKEAVALVDATDRKMLNGVGVLSKWDVLINMWHVYYLDSRIRLIDDVNRDGWYVDLEDE